MAAGPGRIFVQGGAGWVHVPSDATPSASGLMSGVDKNKLNGLVSSAGTKRTSNYTASIGDFVIADPTTGAFTITLPPTSGGAGSVILKVQSNSANAVTVAPSGADTIDGAAGTQQIIARESLYLVSDGVSDWMVVS